ncbi:hypothetical protein ACP70R_016227 [Stipagrostis hirtigluma subsp. patula]
MAGGRISRRGCSNGREADDGGRWPGHRALLLQLEGQQEAVGVGRRKLHGGATKSGEDGRRRAPRTSTPPSLPPPPTRAPPPNTAAPPRRRAPPPRCLDEVDADLVPGRGGGMVDGGPDGGQAGGRARPATGGGGGGEAELRPRPRVMAVGDTCRI